MLKEAENMATGTERLEHARSGEVGKHGDDLIEGGMLNRYVTDYEPVLVPHGTTRHTQKCRS